MAKQSLPIKDGNGSLTSLQVDSGSYGLIPNHFISSSVSDPLWITGSVEVTPVVSASITASVPAQLTASISSSIADPIYLSGSVYVADTYSQSGSVSLLVKTTGSSEILTVSKPARVITRDVYSPSNMPWGSSNSGAVDVVGDDDNRKGLIITNLSSYPFYIAVGISGSELKGFTISDKTKAPDSYTLALYPSGAYFADETTVNCVHGLFLPSGTFADPNAPFISITQITYT